MTFASSQKVDPFKGKVLIEEYQSVLASSIFKELFGVSKAACALRCKRSKKCVKAAINQKDSKEVCLHLKESNATDDNEKVIVRVLEEFKNNPKRTYIINDCMLCVMFKSIV